MDSVHTVSRSGDGGLLSLLGCGLVACWLLPGLRDLMTCLHDTYVALSPCCLIRIYWGVWVWCTLSVAEAFTVSCKGGTFTVVILCSGFLFTERCYRARFGNIPLSSLPVCLNFSCSHALHCWHGPWRSRLCLPLRWASWGALQ